MVAEVKGNGIYLFKQYVVDSYGDKRFEEIVRSMPEETREHMQGTILSDRWYPIETIQDYLCACEKMLGTEDLRKMAQYAVDKQIVGFFHYLLRIISFEKVMSNMDKMWSKYYSTGSLQLVEISDDMFIVEIRGFCFTPSHLTGFRFYLEELFKKITEKKISCKTEAIGPDDTRFTFHIFL